MISELNTYDKNIIEKIKKYLTSDLLHKNHKSKSGKSKTTNPLSGHCYVASEAAYHLFAKDLGLKPWYVKVNGVSHWFLAYNYLSKYLKTVGFYIYEDEKIDITASQFKTLPNYSQARPKGFLTKQPSKRAQILIEKVVNDEEGEI